MKALIKNTLITHLKQTITSYYNFKHYYYLKML